MLAKVVAAAVVATSQDRPTLVDGEAAERAHDLGQVMMGLGLALDATTALSTRSRHAYSNHAKEVGGATYGVELNFSAGFMRFQCWYWGRAGGGGGVAGGG